MWENSDGAASTSDSFESASCAGYTIVTRHFRSLENQLCSVILNPSQPMSQSNSGFMIDSVMVFGRSSPTQRQSIKTPVSQIQKHTHTQKEEAENVSTRLNQSRNPLQLYRYTDYSRARKAYGVLAANYRGRAGTPWVYHRRKVSVMYVSFIKCNHG